MNAATGQGTHSLMMRLTIWFSSTRIGQKVYAKMVPPIDRRLMLWSDGRWSLSPKGQPEGLGGLGMLTTIGAKSGQQRHTPLGYACDGDNVVILASNASRPTHPAWYFNLKKHPEVELIRAGGGKGRYLAEEVPAGPERDRLWKIACAMNPGFEKYPARTGGRLIPVIKCTPLNAK
jgi:deazaflavin-dependent oxidoreductase (nitroreductase family)